MSGATEIELLQVQLVDLQTQVAFQEDSITALNAALAAQQQDLDLLKRQWHLLKQEFSEQQHRPGGDVADEKPPHY